MANFNRVIPAQQQADNDLSGVRTTYFERDGEQWVTYIFNNGNDSVEGKVADLMNAGMVATTNTGIATGFANALAASADWSQV